MAIYDDEDNLENNDIENNNTSFLDDEEEKDLNIDDELEKENIYEERKILYYEPEFDLVRTNPQAVWMKYDERIKKTLKIMAFWKSFDREDLYQQAYIYHVGLCQIYTPFYKGHFYPFDKFLFKNLIIKLRAYIQSYYLKHKREQPTEISERTSSTERNNVADKENEIFVEQLYALVSERQARILELTFKGYKQQEIGKILNISQSRVSVIKKKTIKILAQILEQNNKQDK